MTKNESGEANNKLTVQTWRRSKRAGAIDCDVTYKGPCKVKKNSLMKNYIHSVIEEVH